MNIRKQTHFVKVMLYFYNNSNLENSVKQTEHCGAEEDHFKKLENKEQINLENKNPPKTAGENLTALPAGAEKKPPLAIFDQNGGFDSVRNRDFLVKTNLLDQNVSI